MDESPLTPLRELSRDEQRVWGDIVPYIVAKCAPIEPVQPIDRFAPEMLVFQVTILRRLRTEIEGDGRVLHNTITGEPYPHPGIEMYAGRYWTQLADSS